MPTPTPQAQAREPVRQVMQVRDIMLVQLVMQVRELMPAPLVVQVQVLMPALQLQLLRQQRICSTTRRPA
jgi:hypothetical protein